MFRFTLVFALMVLAGFAEPAAAQSGLISDLPTPTLATMNFDPRPAGGPSLPTQPLSAEALPYVLIFSLLPPLRAAEAVGLGVGTVIALDQLKRDSRYGYDRQEHRFFLREDKRSRGGMSLRRRGSYIHRYF